MTGCGGVSRRRHRCIFTAITSSLSPLLVGYLAVKSIKKQHLVEVRSMANPPAAVKLALESICLLLGESTTDWKQIRSIIMRENFIPTIVNFSADEIRWLTLKHFVVAETQVSLCVPEAVISSTAIFVAKAKIINFSFTPKIIRILFFVHQ